ATSQPIIASTSSVSIGVLSSQTARDNTPCRGLAASRPRPAAVPESYAPDEPVSSNARYIDCGRRGRGCHLIVSDNCFRNRIAQTGRVLNSVIEERRDMKKLCACIVVSILLGCGAKPHPQVAHPTSEPSARTAVDLDNAELRALYDADQSDRTS